MTQLQVSQLAAEALVSNPNPNLQVSQLAAEALVSNPNPNLQVSQLAVMVLQPSPLTLAGVGATFSMTVTPSGILQTAQLVGSATTMPLASTSGAISLSSYSVSHTRVMRLLATNPRITPVTITLDASTPVTGYSPGGSTIGAISQAAAVAVSSGTSALTDKLNKSAADTLSGAIKVTTSGGFVAGTLSWDNAGNRLGGIGVAMTSKGLVGYGPSGPTFSIDQAGNATFSGTLSAATGSFQGNITAGGTVDVTGFIKATGTATADTWRTGHGASIVGMPSDPSTYSHGVIGHTDGYGCGTVGGSKYGFGGFFIGQQNSYGLVATNWGDLVNIFGTPSSRAVAFWCNGIMKKDGTELVNNLRAEYAQKLWSPGAVHTLAVKDTGITTGSATATRLANKPGTSSSSQWLPIEINGVTKYIEVFD